MPAKRTITVKHLALSLNSISMYCDAIRKALETMDPKGELEITLPARVSRQVRACAPHMEFPGAIRCCPPEKRRRTR